MIDSIIIVGIILAGLLLGCNLTKLWGRGFKMNYTRRYGFLIYVAVIACFATAYTVAWGYYVLMNIGIL